MAPAEHNLTVAALWCIGGITVTVCTYSLATASPEGSHYFVAWGAILFGGIQFLKGLFSIGRDAEVPAAAMMTAVAPRVASTGAGGTVTDLSGSQTTPSR